MNIESHDKAIDLLKKALPLSGTIKIIDKEKEGSLIFAWSGVEFIIHLKDSKVYRHEKLKALWGDSLSLLVTRLLEIELINQIQEAW